MNQIFLDELPDYPEVNQLKDWALRIKRLLQRHRDDCPCPNHMCHHCCNGSALMYEVQLTRPKMEIKDDTEA